MKDTLKILFNEDVPLDAELIWRELTKNEISFKKLLVDNKKDFIEGLKSFDPDLIISDYSLPQFTGMQALLIRNEISPLTPFILVTGSNNETVAVDCMRAGADDYILKDNLSRLGPAVVNSLNKKELLKEKKQIEAELIQSEERFRGFYGNVTIGMYRTTKNGKIIMANPALVKMLGFETFDELEQRNLEKEGYEPDYPRSVFLETIEKHNEIIGLESAWHKRDGSTIFVRESARAIRDEQGQILYFDGTIEDITERKLAEEAISQERSMLRTLIDNLPDPIYVLDINCRKVIANNADVKNIGADSEDEVLGKTDIELFPGEVGLRGHAVNEEIISSGKEMLELEEDFIDKDGVRRWLLTTKIPLRNNHGTITGLVGIGHDITERKQNEKELIRAKEKAEEGDRLKSAFLTNMSHEIRTPMNGILGFTELLKEPLLTVEEQQGFIQTIQISGARMLNTINSIVDISKIESGLISVNIKETNLNEKIEFTYKFFKPEVESKGLKFLFKTGLPTNEAIINTDNEKVYGILTNLVRNAIKFTYEGSIEFGYVLKSDSEIVERSRNAELEFFVKDTGVGIPENQKELIFGRFRQGSESHNRGYEGSGLGLSISKSYAEMLGGKIWVESEEGKGSTFYFTIPYNPVLEESTEIKDVDSSEILKVQTKNLKILIVEDDEVSYSLLKITIQKIGKEFLHAITGVQAIEACRCNPDLDLVLMDIRMPMMDGIEATRQIRQFNKDVIIIAQTAYAFAGDSEKALEAGCNDYISKPINKTLLFELIRKHCNK